MQTILDMLEEHAILTPDAPALVFDTRTTDFASLFATINKIAQFLLKKGISRGDRIGIYMQRGEQVDENLLILLGIMRIATYIPIETTTPRERLQALVHDAQITTIVTHNKLLPQIHAISSSDSLKIISWEEILADDTPLSPLTTAQQSTADDLAYILYTSGTSQGKPKGVKITHRSLAHFARVFNQRLNIRPGDRSTQFFSLSFDASFAEIVMLVGGATLHPVPAPLLLGGAPFFNFLREHEITIAHGIPSLVQKLPPLTLPGLRLLVLGGENCPASLIQKHAHPELTIINACGLTETTVCYALGACVNDGLPPSIGYALPGCSVSIRDEALQLVPVGVVGQICVAGICLASGYTSEELTRERFVADPLSPEEILFLTMDEGVMNEAGEIRFLGRQDAARRTKIAGKLINLDEIESMLLEHPQIEDCAVEFIENRVIAYLTLHTHETQRTNLPHELEAYLEQKLFDYMLPKAYVLLAKFPRNASDKIDRLGLRTIPLQSWMFAAYNKPHQASSPEEQQLAEIIATMLNQQTEELAMLASLLDEGEATSVEQIRWEEIDISQPASELGLESLQAPDFTTLVFQQCGVDIPLQEFFVPLATLASSIEAQKQKETHV